MIKSVSKSPCEGAMQIGSTYDLRAIWRKNGRLFMVMHDAKSKQHIIDVGEGEIVRRIDPPIPYEMLGGKR